MNEAQQSRASNRISVFIFRYRVYIGLMLVIIHMAPYFVLGENVIIGDFDNFDSSMVWLKILADTGTAFSGLDSIVPSFMDGIPRNCFGSEFNVALWLFCIFPPYIAYVVNVSTISIIGYVGMYLLLKNHFITEKKNDWIAVGVAICFAILPFYPPGGVSVSSIPLALNAFMNIRNRTATKWDWVGIGLIPLYSSFIYTYIFFISIIVFWLIIDLLKTKKLNKMFLVSIIFMIGIFLLVEYRLVYMLLFDKNFVSHRTEFYLHASSDADIVKVIWNTFIFGDTGPGLINYRIIIVGGLIGIILAAKKRNLEIKNMLIIIGMITLISIWNGLWFSIPLEFLKVNVEIVRTFQLNRYTWLIAPMWVLFFGIGLILIKSVDLPKKMTRYKLKEICIFSLIGLQLFTTFSFNYDNYMQQLHQRPVMSYKQFFAESLFTQIKQDIALPVESFRVVSLCIHPSVTQYNGFYTIDGYMNNYPLEYKHQFRRIIENELAKSDKVKAYFDEWGNRCYLFSSEQFGFTYTKDNQPTISNLAINTTVLVEMNCKYVFAAVPIGNYNALGLTYLASYTNVDAAWLIHLYQVF